MKEKNNFLIYHDSYTIIEELTIQERGELFTSLYHYSMYGEIPEYESRSLLSLAFKSIRTAIDISNKRYQAKCEKNSESANKRWTIVFINNEELNEKKFNERYPNGYWDSKLQLCFNSFEECYNHQMSLNSKEIREQFNNDFELDKRIKEYLNSNAVA